MKRSIIFSVFAVLLLLAGCRKEDNPKIPELTRVPVPKITLDASSDAFINPVDPASFKGKVVVGLHFQEDAPLRKMDLVIRKNNNTTRVFRENITSFPTTVEFTGQQLITLFGAPIVGGDKFDVGVNITTVEGQVFEAFPSGAAGYGSGIGNMVGASTSVSYLTPCPFDATKYVGDFEVVQDEWADYKAGSVIPVKMVSATQLSFEYNVDAGSAQPIILTINPANNSITVAKQAYGTYTFPPPVMFSAQSVAGPANAVNPCDLSISVRLNHTDANGTNYGNYTIKLKKK